MIQLLGFIQFIIGLYIWIIIAGAVLSWLIAFNVINPYNQLVRSIILGVDAITEPLLRPIRQILPSTGGIDFSPLVLIVALIGIKDYFIPWLATQLA